MTRALVMAVLTLAATSIAVAGARSANGAPMSVEQTIRQLDKERI